MSYLTLIQRSLRFHARAHLGTALGAMVGSAVLIGALIIGDSVRGSLRDMALDRIGNVEFALPSDDRFFQADLAERIAESLDVTALPVLQLAGTAARTDGTARANSIQLLGVTPRFWDLGRSPSQFPALESNDVALNQRLAQHLDVEVGDTILIRFARPSALSREAAISPQDDASLALRLTVRAIPADDQMGRFSLRASQIPPFNAFIAIGWLQELLDLQQRANLLLVSHAQTHTLDALNTTLRDQWQLADAELELRHLPAQDRFELRTRRVFLDPPVAEIASSLTPDAQGVLTYFVNELRANDRTTPYSMVTASAPPLIPPDFEDDHILVNAWLADDLQLTPGDTLELTYFILGLGRTLEEQSARFRVHSIVPLAGPAADPELMPEFPGVDQAESTRDWDPTLPVDLSRIRAEDEQYWTDHRGTPKAFIPLATGQRLWDNRFGNLTAVRYLISNDPDSRRATLEADLLARIDPASVNLRFENVRQPALAAAGQSQDFGGLFLGFSFFLIAAALLLMALLFQFGIEQRSVETGTLLALGFSPRRVRQLLLFEGGIIALLGTIPGIAGGVAYAHLMLHGLSTLWRDAVGTAALRFHAEPTTFLLGAIASALVAWITIWLTLRKQARQPARELLAESAASRADRSASDTPSPARRFRTAAILAVLAILLLGFMLARADNTAPAAFFGVGALWLLAGLALSAAGIAALATSDTAAQLSLAGIAVRNVTRRRKRSLAILALLACGSFLIASIGVFRLDAESDADQPSSGTGGFSLIGESSLPIVHDLNTEGGREFYALDEPELERVRFFSFRVRDGDDASCLNLNRAQQPRLLGVQPGQLATRNAFTFARIADNWPDADPWLLLKQHPFAAHSSPAAPPGPEEPASTASGSINAMTRTNPVVIPAIGDLNSILWAMGRKVGDTLTYTDERGRAFDILIVGAVANSILQGNLIIDEAAFAHLFPSEPGYRFFLIDAPPDEVEPVATSLARALGDAGLELTPAIRRLNQFNAVQNTYLGTFQILGGLGLILGSVGLGIVVLRNVFERRSELALLLAIGYRPRALKQLVLLEHSTLLVAGLSLGIAAAFIAVLPSLLSPAAQVPYASLSLTLLAVLTNGALWTWAATSLALRGQLLPALRNE
jgi:putative ABC transport system permease protein